jgi:hypothetical protein
MSGTMNSPPELVYVNNIIIIFLHEWMHVSSLYGEQCFVCNKANGNNLPLFRPVS